MRSVVQRVTSASVTVDGQVVGQIGIGLLVLLGVQEQDTQKDALYLADKVCKLRIFEDEQGKMNLSVKDVGGQILMVSQFTLLGDARGQNRPSFINAAAPEEADRLYQIACQRVQENGVPCETGTFRAHMQVALVNDGPVTIMLDSAKQF